MACAQLAFYRGAAGPWALARARELVMRYGRNATCYQILNPGFSYWFSADGDAVVGFVPAGGYYVAAGEPVAPAEARTRAAAEFAADSRQRGFGVLYVCAEPPFLEQLRATNLPTAAVTIGAQPVWRPRQWAQMAAGNASLRSQIRRPARKGLIIESVDSGAAQRDPRLRRLLRQWLDRRHMPALHFLTEPQMLRGLVADRLVWVGSINGHPLAYLVASPVKLKNGYLIEQIVRSPRAPNGAAEALVNAAMREIACRGCDFVSLGLVALSRQAAGMADNPPWVRALFTWARAHGQRFYRFAGLENFRLKMLPDHWEPLYLISQEKTFGLPALLAMAGAFSRRPLWQMGAAAGLVAVRQEVKNAGHWLRR